MQYETLNAYFQVDDTEINKTNRTEMVEISGYIWDTAKLYRKLQELTQAELLEGIFERLWKRINAFDGDWQDGRYYIIKAGV